MFASKDLFFSKPSGYQISRSVRLRSSATAYFNRTPASAGNRKTFTFSFWVKIGDLGTGIHEFFNSYDLGSNEFSIDYRSNSFYFYSYQTTIQLGLTTTAVFRDPSAWYHIVVQADTTQAVASDRAKIWVNGVLQAITSPTYPALNADLYWNVSGKSARIGGRENNSAYFDGYLTEINFIDGQALTPSSFGQTNPVTGVWQPLKYTGTYGTNGFYLNFSDNSAATAAAIGKDYSGNGNNWTPNNISVTAGTTYDSMLDVPTPYADGGNGRGNYCTLNPLLSRWSIGAATFSAANLQVTSSNASSMFAVGTQANSSGKWYYETTVLAVGTNTPAIGVADERVQNTTLTAEVAYLSNGQKEIAGTGSAYGASYTTNDIIGVAYDLDGSTVTFYKNGVSQGAISLSVTANILPYCSVILNANLALNFGQRPFIYTPPTGYVALNTQNLPTPTISNGANYMAATTYTGNGTSLSVVNAGNFQPDLVWMKDRTAIENHELQDSVRGATKLISSNNTNAEVTATNTLTSFNTNGFSIGNSLEINRLNDAYVAWQWKAGGTSSSNTNGSITSTVSLGATQGFSVVTYTGTGANATVGHGLGVAPKMIIFKVRSTTNDWTVYHSSLPTPATQALFLNLTNAAATSTTVWNSTNPTSSVFSIGTSTVVNVNAATFVAYCFSAVAGYSAFGSYTGNGSADGPFAYLGFRPRFVMIKRTDSTGNWQIIDTSRSTYNEAVATLYPNLSNAEDLTNTKLDALSNGFKIRGTPSTDFNTNGSTYVYACFAENPFKISLAR